MIGKLSLVVSVFVCLAPAFSADSERLQEAIRLAAGQEGAIERLKIFHEYYPDGDGFDDQTALSALHLLVESNSQERRSAAISFLYAKKEAWSVGAARFINSQYATNLISHREFSGLWAWMPDEMMVDPGPESVERLVEAFGAEGEDADLIFQSLVRIGSTFPTRRPIVEGLARKILGSAYSGYLKSEAREFLGAPASLDDVAE